MGSLCSTNTCCPGFQGDTPCAAGPQAYSRPLNSPQTDGGWVLTVSWCTHGRTQRAAPGSTTPCSPCTCVQADHSKATPRMVDCSCGTADSVCSCLLLLPAYTHRSPVHTSLHLSPTAQPWPMRQPGHHNPTATAPADPPAACLTAGGALSSPAGAAVLPGEQKCPVQGQHEPQP